MVTPRIPHFIVRRMPWVTFLEREPKPCRECGELARWRFRSVKRQRQAYDGVHCWDHLFTNALYADADERARTTRFLERMLP